MSSERNIITWADFRDNHLVRRMLPFRWDDIGTYYRVTAFDGPSQILATTVDKGTDDEADFVAHYKDRGNYGLNSIVQGFSIPWHGVRQIAVDHNLVPTLGHVACMGFRTVWVTYKGVTFTCQIKDGTSDDTDFTTNFLPLIRPAVDCDGKQYVRIYSGDQSWQTVSYSCRADDMVNQVIGGGVELTFDASAVSGARAFDAAVDGFRSKTIYCAYTEAVRILKGSMFWVGGGLDCTVRTSIVCPEGGILGLYPDGTPIFAPYEWPVYKHITDQHFLGDCPGGLAVFSESSSDPIPTGYQLKIVLKVPEANTTWKGCIRVDSYRTSTV